MQTQDIKCITTCDSTAAQGTPGYIERRPDHHPSAGRKRSWKLEGRDDVAPGKLGILLQPSNDEHSIVRERE